MQLRHRISASVFVCAALFTAGCSLVGGGENTDWPEPVDFSALSQDSTLLVGTWEWERSTYYFTGDGKPSVHTPSSTGRTETLIFTPDDTVRVYHNGELAHEMTYGAYLDGTMWGVSHERFARSTAYVDGPESVYVRSE